MNSLGKIYFISRGGKKEEERYQGKIAYWSSKRQVERSNLASERKLRSFNLPHAQVFSVTGLNDLTLSLMKVWDILYQRENHMSTDK